MSILEKQNKNKIKKNPQISGDWVFSFEVSHSSCLALFWTPTRTFSFCLYYLISESTVECEKKNDSFQ